MGANSSKKEILEELKNSVDDKNRYNQNNPRIECKNNYIIDKDDEKNSDEPFDFSFENRGDINNNELDIKNIKIFPYSAIGTISVQFPISDEIYVYTCFSIDTNVVVTLASNIDNKNKGGKAKSIVTSFSKENVKWENIFIQEEEEIKLNNVKGGDKKINKNLNNFSSKLAAIIYDDQVIKECLGAEIRKKKEYDEYYEYGEYYEYDEYYKYDEPKKYAVFSLKRENNNIISIDGKENNSQIKLREIICGKPRILIYRGKILEDAMKKERFTINELQERIRGQNIVNLGDVEYAILETSGQITVIEKPNKRPTIPEDFDIMPEYEGIPYDLVIDGKIMYKNLEALGKDYTWLKKEVNKFNFNPEEALVVTIDGKGQIFCQKKES